MAQTFNIKIDEADLTKVKKAFSDMQKIGARVTMRSLNKTLSGVKTDSSKSIREEITAKKAAVDETFKISKASVDKPSAWIASTGKPLALIDFSTSKTQKGISVRVRKDRPRKIIPGTFITKMKSGHEGVFWRKWHDSKSTKRRKGMPPAFLRKSMARQGYFYNSKTRCFVPAGILPKAYRLPIKERFGPRVPDIMGNEPVMKKILSQADDRLHKNLMHEMDYELSKHK